MMPYKSDAQRKFMHAQHPKIAARWDKEYPNQKGLPEHVKKDNDKSALFDEFSETQRQHPGLSVLAKALPVTGQLTSMANMVNEFEHGNIGRGAARGLLPFADLAMGAPGKNVFAKEKGPYNETTKKKDSEKKSSTSEGQPMTLIESVVDAFQANAAALGKAEEIINEKQAADHAYGELIPKVVDICARFGKIDNTADEKQALATMLATPAGALDVIAKLAAFVDEGAPSSIGGQQVDASGRQVHLNNGQQKQASYDSLQNPHVGRRQSERDNKSWTDFPRNLGIQ